MLKRTGWLGRTLVIAAVGVVFGLAGVVGQSVAQTEGAKKSDKPMTSDDTMMKGDKEGEMKSDDMKKDGKAMMKDDKMMRGDKTMEKKQ